MKKRKISIKAWVIVAIILIIIIVAVIVNINKKNKHETTENDENSYVEVIADGIRINKSTKLNESKLVNGLLISNIQLTESDGMTTLLADVTNKTEQKTSFKKLRIILLDENENEISSMIAFLNNINAGETTQLNVSTTSNYIKAYDFKVVEE